MEAENLARSERLVRLQSLLNRAQRGLTTQEIAERCGVCRRTAQRDLRSLEKLNYPLAEEDGRYSLMPGSVIPPIRLNLEEATALFIAARARRTARCFRSSPAPGRVSERHGSGIARSNR